MELVKEVTELRLRLVKLDMKYQRHLNDMMEEWYATGEKIIPYAIRRLDYREFDKYLNSLENQGVSEGLVPDSTYFCLDEERDIFVGAVNIRHYLNDSLLLNGGHIGDGVRPSERRKGIATEMIDLALKECKKIGINKVLMVCDKENIGSAKCIQKNGGILENEIIVDGIVERRYWITI
jgi:predicted acetyltransferase